MCRMCLLRHFLKLFYFILMCNSVVYPVTRSSHETIYEFFSLVLQNNGTCKRKKNGTVYYILNEIN